MNEKEKPKNATEQKPKRNWSVAEKCLLRIGGIIGAIIAVLTIPSAVHGVWKGWQEGMAGRDRSYDQAW